MKSTDWTRGILETCWPDLTREKVGEKKITPPAYIYLGNDGAVLPCPCVGHRVLHRPELVVDSLHQRDLYGAKPSQAPTREKSAAARRTVVRTGSVYEGCWLGYKQGFLPTTRRYRAGGDLAPSPS